VSRRARTRRERKILLSIWGAIVGLTAVTALVVWIEISRNTDLADPTAGITRGFRDAEGHEAPPIRFEDVAVELGISMQHGRGARRRNLPEDTGSGIAWGDVDGDGDPDLYVVNFPGARRDDQDDDARDTRNRLFLNDGGRFTDVTDRAGVADAEGFGMGASFADYDGDSRVDLYVTNHGPNRLFRNLGDGTFEEVAGAAGVADPSWSTRVAWGDYDLDGNLDLYVCNYIDYEDFGFDGAIEVGTAGGAYAVPFTLNPNSFDPQPNRLYRNRGDGTFEDVAATADVANTDGRSLAATFCDLDGDGWLDLYVNNDVSANCLYRCEGATGDNDEVVFLDLSSVTGTADPRGSMGLSVGEIITAEAAGDGLPDLFITHWVAQENALYQSLAMPSGQVEYRDKTRRMRLGEISIDTVGWGCAMVDLDLDGLIDIAVANGSTLERKENLLELVPEPMFLFWNAGDAFLDVAPNAGTALAARRVARGMAAADFDADGDVDLAIAVNQGRPLLLRNDTANAGQSLRVRLRAPAAAAFGARVEVEVGGRLQTRWYGADVGYLGSHDSEMVFGLGEHVTAERVRVTWTSSRPNGLRSERTNVPAGVIEIALPRE